MQSNPTPLLLNSTSNHAPSIPPLSDIELLSMQSIGYTSLKDILPASPPTMTSPTLHNSSWSEIPIKNHLVKQAALAYLQPACSLPEVGRKDLLGRLKDAVEECGCVLWFNDVVVKSFRDLFSQARRSAETGDYDCEYNCGYDYNHDDYGEDYQKG